MGDPMLMHQLASLPIDMLGFIFYPASKRYMIGKIDPVEIAGLPESIQKIGVFVNASKMEILEKIKTYHLTGIQLHGNETTELCKELKEEGLTIIKAFNLKNDNNYGNYDLYCDYFLFDTPSSQYGGTGEHFDWSLLANYHGATPFILSGGIGPGDEEALGLINHPQFAGIDLNSKFEISPGIKDINKVKVFIEVLSNKC